MKIISKRGRKAKAKPEAKPEAKEVEVEFGHFGIIIVDGSMTPEEIKRAEEAMKELRRQLDELQDMLDTGWYNLRKD